MRCRVVRCSRGVEDVRSKLRLTRNDRRWRHGEMGTITVSVFTRVCQIVSVIALCRLVDFREAGEIRTGKRLICEGIESRRIALLILLRLGY